MKKVYYLLCILIGAIFLTPNVYAKEIYYVNKNGVQFDEREYIFLSKMYWDGSQELFTEKDYHLFVNSDIINGDFETKELELPMTRGSEFHNNNISLKISKSCTTNCLISITTNWNTNPLVKSYDTIGAYLENTSLVTNPRTVVISDSQSINYDSNMVKSASGFGSSVLLPNSNSIIVNQEFRVSRGGTVYGSYQHATRDISLANSKNYTISKSGFGKVFNFNGIAASIYDRTPGVEIIL